MAERHMGGQMSKDVFGEGLGEAISKYVKRDKRYYRIGLHTTEEEYDLLKRAAKSHKTPVATMARACALFGAAAVLEAKGIK
jgi:hypothetical protein